MAKVRKTGRRDEFDANWVVTNALVADLALLIASVGLTIEGGNNSPLGLDQLVAGIADVLSIHTNVILALDDDQAMVERYEHGTVANALVANGGTAGNLKTTNAADFRINGAIFTKAATDDLWDLSAETDTAADKFRAYWLYLDSSGVATFAASTDEDTEAAAIAALPSITDTKSVIGVYAAGLATDFDAGGGLAAQGTIFDGWPSTLAATASDPAALTASATVGIANGATAGNLQTQSDTEYSVKGQVFRKAATDDLWDLSGETDTDGSTFRAYWLYVDASGVATIDAGTNATSEALAIAALPAETATKCPFGVYVAGVSTDFDDGGAPASAMAAPTASASFAAFRLGRDAPTTAI